MPYFNEFLLAYKVKVRKTVDHTVTVKIPASIEIEHDATTYIKKCFDSGEIGLDNVTPDYEIEILNFDEVYQKYKCVLEVYPGIIDTRFGRIEVILRPEMSDRRRWVYGIRCDTFKKNEPLSIENKIKGSNRLAYIRTNRPLFKGDPDETFILLNLEERELIKGIIEYLR